MIYECLLDSINLLIYIYIFCKLFLSPVLMFKLASHRPDLLGRLAKTYLGHPGHHDFLYAYKVLGGKSRQICKLEMSWYCRGQVLQTFSMFCLFLQYKLFNLIVLSLFFIASITFFMKSIDNF